MRSLGFDLDHLIADKKLRLDYVRIERSEIEETGDYDLEGLFVRLGYAIDSIGGMAHSNQVREYRITDHGVELLDVYLGPGGSLTGSGRLAQEAKERAEETFRKQESPREQVQMEADRKATEAQIAALQAKLAATELEMQVAAAQDDMRRARVEADKAAMARSRQDDAAPDGKGTM